MMDLARQGSERAGSPGDVDVLEVSEHKFHRWRNQYGGGKVEEAKLLKKLLAESELDMEIRQKPLRETGERRTSTANNRRGASGDRRLADGLQPPSHSQRIGLPDPCRKRGRPPEHSRVT